MLRPLRDEAAAVGDEEAIARLGDFEMRGGGGGGGGGGAGGDRRLCRV